MNKLTRIAVLCSAAILPALAYSSNQSTSSTPSTSSPGAASSSSPKTSGSSSGYGSGSASTSSTSAVGSDSFVKTAAQDGMTEVEAGKLALSKSKSADVKKLAQHIVNDHEKANNELKSIAKTKGITVPTALDAQHKAKLDSLKDKSGSEFDAAYLKEMSMAHDQAIALFKQESSSAGDQDLKSFAQKTLPTLEEHKRMIAESGSSQDAHASRG